MFNDEAQEAVEFKSSWKTERWDKVILSFIWREIYTRILNTINLKFNLSSSECTLMCVFSFLFFYLLEKTLYGKCKIEIKLSWKIK